MGRTKDLSEKGKFIYENGKYIYYDASGRMIITVGRPKEPDLWEEYDNCQKKAERIVKELPYEDCNWTKVIPTYKKDYFDSLPDQLRYLGNVLDGLNWSIKKLNKLLKEQNDTFKRINEFRLSIKESPYGKSTSKIEKYRDMLFEDWTVIKKEYKTISQDLEQYQFYIDIENKSWKLIYKGQEVPFKDLKGAYFYHFLLRHPRRKYHASEFEGYVWKVANLDIHDNNQIHALKENQGIDINQRLSLDDRKSDQKLTTNKLIEKIDKRLTDIKKEIELYNNEKDPGYLEKIEELEEEKEQYINYLKVTTKKVGEKTIIRSFTNHGQEKARKRISATMKTFRDHVYDCISELGKYLDEYFDTGKRFVYTPPAEELPWITIKT